jgi:uncharacterized membrane protein YcaP (DUF421 family)
MGRPPFLVQVAGMAIMYWQAWQLLSRPPFACGFFRQATIRGKLITRDGGEIMELLTLFGRTVLIYFVVFGVIRIMGKREIGKLSVFDFVISIMIAEMAVFIIDDPEMPVLHGLLPMLTLVLIQILTAFVSLKNRKIRLLFDGTPSYLIENGKLNQEEMRKQRYTLDDLMMQLREKNIADIGKVEFAVLETSGKLSVIEKEDKTDVQPEDRSQTADSSQKEEKSLNGNDSSKGGGHSQKEDAGQRKIKGTESGKESPRIRYEGLPLPLIMDGKVQDDNLEKIGKTRFWLKNELQAYHIKDFKDVFFCTIDHRGRFFIDLKKKT